MSFYLVGMKEKNAPDYPCKAPSAGDKNDVRIRFDGDQVMDD